MNRTRRRVFEVLEVAGPGDVASRVFDVFIFSLILLNVIAVIVETTAYGKDFERAFYLFELVSVSIFTVEYLLRVWSCVENPLYSKPLAGRLRFAVTLLALIDLAAVLPFFIPMVIAVDLRFLRILRLIRIFRVFKLARYVESLRVLTEVATNKKREIFITLFIAFLLLLISSSLMYHAENQANPGSFPSIPAAMWWGVCTMTTVGYGDVYPVTALGKLLAAVIAVLGVGMFALPAGILGAGFMEAMSNNKKQPATCPHCGKVINGDE